MQVKLGDKAFVEGAGGGYLVTRRCRVACTHSAGECAYKQLACGG